MGNEKKDKIELTEEEFLAKIKENNLGDYLVKYTAKIADQRVSSGIDTFKKNLQAKDLTDKERLQEVENELKELKDTNLKSSLNNSIKDSLKAAGLSEGFLKFIRVDKEEDIGAAVKDLGDNILQLKQLDIDNKLKGNEPPVKGLPGNGGDSTLETYVENKNAGKIAGNPFAGKLEK